MNIDIIKTDEVIRKVLIQYMITTLVKPQNYLQHPWFTCSTFWFRQKISECEVQYTIMEERTFDHDFYVMATRECVEKHLQALKIPIRIVFGQPTKQSLESIQRIENFKNIIARLYLTDIPPQRLDGFAVENTKKTFKKRFSCTGCGKQEMILDKDSDNLLICAYCGIQKEVYQHAINYDDARRVNISQKNPNDKRNHFISCFNQYQGIAKSDVPKEIFDQIEKELVRYGLVEQSKDTRADQFARVSREHIRLILKDLKLFKLYGDNLTHIYRTITDKHQNVLHLKEKILQDFDIFNDLYTKRYPNPNKKSFNYQQLLYHFLLRHGHQCNLDDFNFLKTTERKIQHDNIYKALFQELGWNYTSFF